LSLSPKLNLTISSDLKSKERSVLLFANTNLYILVRLLHTALDRLHRLSRASASLSGQPFFTEKRNLVAVHLDLLPKPMSDGGLPEGDFFASLIQMLRRLVAGDLESSIFEEQVRFMFGTAAYPVFTFDKLIQSIVKQVQVILGDPTCEQLIRLFDSWNNRKQSLRLSEYSARLAVENAVSAKDFLYRIEFLPKSDQIAIQLLERLSGSEGAGAVAPNSAEAKWSAYVDSFVKTECNSQYFSEIPVFLNRTKRRGSRGRKGNRLQNLYIQFNLECKIAVNTYKLFYVENTEDFLFRCQPRSIPSLGMRSNRPAGIWKKLIDMQEKY
jgi:paired amphipathic helix protein Sin3a